jgi:hypothetical protein
LRDVATVVGYIDTGGRADEVDTQAGGIDSTRGWTSIIGSVHDSLTGRPLVGARVQVSGSRVSALTDETGGYVLDRVPSGAQSIAFFHARLSEIGWPSPVVSVELPPDSTVSLDLSVPSFRSVAETLCPASSTRPETVLVGRVTDPSGSPMGPAPIQARWETFTGSQGMSREVRSEATSGSDGRYVLCELPPGLPVQVRVRVGGRWHEVLEIEMPDGQVVARTSELRLR